MIEVEISDYIIQVYPKKIILKEKGQTVLSEEIKETPKQITIDDGYLLLKFHNNPPTRLLIQQDRIEAV